jgi:cobalamin biosynthesis Co2+ chelatase CbiK
VFLDEDRMMDNVEKYTCANVPSSQIFRSYLRTKMIEKFKERKLNSLEMSTRAPDYAKQQKYTEGASVPQRKNILRSQNGKYRISRTYTSVQKQGY